MPLPPQLSIKSLVLAGMLLPCGCGGGNDPPKPNVDTVSDAQRDSADSLTDPVEILRRTFDRYRNARTYQDAAELVATTSIDGRVSSRAVAPLSVWLDHDRLFVAAYEVRIWSDGKRMNAWMVSPQTDHFDSQVLSVAVAGGRPAAEELIVDPILVSTIGGGAGGPPPQLDWLFSADPMSGLFRNQPQIVSRSRVSVDNFLCDVFEITEGGEQFVFYIDRKRSLVRRIDLPAPPINVDGSQTELTLLLRNATFSESSDLPLIDTVPSSPKYVSKWVPIPPEKPLRDVPASVSKNVIPNLRSDTVWITNTRSQETLRWMEELRAMYADSQSNEIVVMVDQKAGGLSQEAGIDAGNIASADFPDMPDESLCLVARDGAIHFHLQLIPPVDPSALMAATSDLAAGFDVRARLLKQWRDVNDAYRRDLSAASLR